MVRLHIANTVSDRIQGDVQEHLPLERLPLWGDVLGLGTTSGWDNGELTFLCDAALRDPPSWQGTRLDKSEPASVGCSRAPVSSISPTCASATMPPTCDGLSRRSG